MTPLLALGPVTPARRASAVKNSTLAWRWFGTAAVVLLGATLPATVRGEEGAANDRRSTAAWDWSQRLVLEAQVSFGDPPIGYYGLALDVHVVRRLSVAVGAGIGPSMFGMGGQRLGVMPHLTVVERGGTSLSLGLGYALKSSANVESYRVGNEVTHVETRWDPTQRIDGELSVAHRFTSGLRLRAFVGVDRRVGDGDTTVTILPAPSVVGSDTLPTAPAPPPSPWSGYAGLAIGFGAPTVPDSAPLSIKGWYGWQILAIDLPSIVAFTLDAQNRTMPRPAETPRATATAHAALGAFTLGAPIVHGAHGHGGRAALSLAARLVIPVAVFAVGMSLFDEGECVALECGREKVLIATSAMMSLFDAALFSWR